MRHYNLGKNNGSWKGGHTLVKHFCIDCGKPISYRSIRCRKCNQRKKISSGELTFRGRHHKESTKKRMQGKSNGMFGVHRFGKDCPFFGHHHTEEWKKLHSGKNAPNWKGGISSLQVRIKALPEYKEWRLAVFHRDYFTCQICGTKSEKGNSIEAHHRPKLFAEIFAEFLQEYNQFSPHDDKDTLVRLAMNYKPFWDIDSGLTLCKKCHKLARENKLGLAMEKIAKDLKDISLRKEGDDK